MYIGPFGAPAGKAEMTLEAVVTFGGGDEGDVGGDEGGDVEVPLN